MGGKDDENFRKNLFAFQSLINHQFILRYLQRTKICNSVIKITPLYEAHIFLCVNKITKSISIC